MSKRKVKKWFRSRTIWTGILGVGVAVVGAYVEGSDWRTSTLAGFAALSVLLRALTKEGIIL